MCRCHEIVTIEIIVTGATDTWMLSGWWHSRDINKQSCYVCKRAAWAGFTKRLCRSKELKRTFDEYYIIQSNHRKQTKRCEQPRVYADARTRVISGWIYHSKML